MARSGPIVIIEDDVDDLEMMKEVFESLKVPNELILFEDCHKAYDYLMAHPDLKPFLILSDINLPRMTGAQLKKK